MTVPFAVEDIVRCRNQRWEVLKVTDNGDGTWTVRLFPEEGGRPRPFLYPHTPIERIPDASDQLESGQLDNLDNYRLLTSATRLSLVYEYDKLLSISNSRLTPEPYQLLAVKQVMESLRQRYLIADDVGLGKTIEAGLIMQELAARQRGKRVLIIVPASLQDQWKKEMDGHFLRKFFIYNSRKMEGIKELVDENLNPWLAKNSIITSIDWIKPQYEGKGVARRNLNRVFDQLVQVEKPWDLVIIDEAHYASTDSNRADLAKTMQERCDSLLLLTATPHSGNPEHFFNLLNLIDPFMFAQPEDLDRSDARERVDKVMIRRGKETIFERDANGNLVKKFKDRDPHAIEIEFSDAEQKLYEDVSEYTATGWAVLNRKRKISTADRNVGKFLLSLVQKRMVSSIYALKQTLDRRLVSIVESRTAEKIDGVSETNLKKLLKDYDKREFMEDEDRELVERYIETRRMQAIYADRTSEVKTLRRLSEEANAIVESGTDSKLSWLLKFLENLFANDPSEKVIIFTEYRDTLEYILENLRYRWWVNDDAIVTIHGGMQLGENDEEKGSKLLAERRFNEPDTRILLATDAASEGLNLQRYCHILLNYELPWNPNRLEQRIGRIHRYGQKKTSVIYNLMIQGSKEAEIFIRLQEKVETIRKQLGNMAEVLGILQSVGLDDLILQVLDNDLDKQAAGEIAEEELKKLDEAAQKIRATQFLSGCRKFADEEIDKAEDAISESEAATPQQKDVFFFVETFLRVFGDPAIIQSKAGHLQQLKEDGLYSLKVPTVIQDDKIPKRYARVTFRRKIANKDWHKKEQPEFLAFGHPLIARMVHYCRNTKAAELGGKVTCMVTDYSGLPGILFNFLLRFEDLKGRPVREEIEPVFVNSEGIVRQDLGHKLYLADKTVDQEPSVTTIDLVRVKASVLRTAAERHIRDHYLDYYKRVEKQRSDEIEVLLEDLQRFDVATSDLFDRRLEKLVDDQLEMFEGSSVKGQRTRIENQQKAHNHRMNERRFAVEARKLETFPAPELLNMVIVVPA